MRNIGFKEKRTFILDSLREKAFNFVFMFFFLFLFFLLGDKMHYNWMQDLIFIDLETDDRLIVDGYVNMHH